MLKRCHSSGHHLHQQQQRRPAINVARSAAGATWFSPSVWQRISMEAEPQEGLQAKVQQLQAEIDRMHKVCAA